MASKPPDNYPGAFIFVDYALFEILPDRSNGGNTKVFGHE